MYYTDSLFQSHLKKHRMYDNILLSNTRTQYRSSSLNKLFLFHGPPTQQNVARILYLFSGEITQKKINKNNFHKNPVIIIRLSQFVMDLKLLLQRT